MFGLQRSSLLRARSRLAACNAPIPIGRTITTTTTTVGFAVKGIGERKGGCAKWAAVRISPVSALAKARNG